MVQSSLSPNPSPGGRGVECRIVGGKGGQNDSSVGTSPVDVRTAGGHTRTEATNLCCGICVQVSVPLCHQRWREGHFSLKIFREILCLWWTRKGVIHKRHRRFSGPDTIFLSYPSLTQQRIKATRGSAMRGFSTRSSGCGHARGMSLQSNSLTSTRKCRGQAYYSPPSGGGAGGEACGGWPKGCSLLIP